MKKLLLMIISILLVGCTVERAKYIDGQYMGLGQGSGGNVQTLVTIEEGKIVSVEVVTSNETQDYLNEVVEKLIPTIITNNGTSEVDLVSGATKSSKGVLDAVNDALKEAWNKD